MQIGGHFSKGRHFHATLEAPGVHNLAKCCWAGSSFWYLLLPRAQASCRTACSLACRPLLPVQLPRRTYDRTRALALVIGFDRMPTESETEFRSILCSHSDCSEIAANTSQRQACITYWQAAQLCRLSRQESEWRAVPATDERQAPGLYPLWLDDASQCAFCQAAHVVELLECDPSDSKRVEGIDC